MHGTMSTSLPPFSSMQSFALLCIAFRVMSLSSRLLCAIISYYFTRFIYLNLRKWVCLAVTYILHSALSCQCLSLSNWKSETEPMPAFLKDPEKESDILSICPTSLKVVPTNYQYYEVQCFTKYVYYLPDAGTSLFSNLFISRTAVFC